MELRFCPVCAQDLVIRPDDDAGRLRLTCPDNHWTHWNNPVPVLAALVELNGKIMLARNAAWPEHMYALITGFMEQGETPEQGIARELAEETGLVADQLSLIGVYEFIRKNEVLICYHVRATGTVNLSAELADYKLLEPGELRPWPAGTGLAVADWLRRNDYPVVFESFESQLQKTQAQTSNTTA